ncbi:MAG: AraC family ligand binding domain-containing protein [Planctomycetes bacterium]|nr:AraC family ligand binding domain-containing protein [Planctomycetota bacterium]
MPGSDDHGWLRRISPQVNFLWRGWFTPRYVEPLRRIYDHELVIVEHGACTVTIAGVEHFLDAGSFLVVPPGTEHVTVAGEEQVLRTCVHFDWEWVHDQPPLPMWTYAPAKASTRLVRPAPAWVPRGELGGRISEPPEIGRLIEALLRRWGDPQLQPSARALFLELLVRLIACQPAIGSPLPGRQALAAAVREALDRSLAEPVSVQDLLSGFDCTYEHANRTFKAVFGLTPVR